MSSRGIVAKRRTYRRVLRIAWDTWPAGTVVVPVLFAGLSAGGLAGALCLGQIVGAVAEQRPGSARTWILLYAASVGGASAAGVGWDRCRRLLTIRVNQAVRERLMGAALAADGVGHLEDPAYADRLETAQRSARPGVLVDNLAALAVSLVLYSATVAALAAVHVLLAAPVVGGTVATAFQVRARRAQLPYLDRAASGQRLGDRIFALSTSPATAAEVRMGGLSAHLVARYHRLGSDVVRELVRGRWREVRASVAAGTVRGLTLAAGIVIVGWLARDRSAGAGDVAAALALVRAGLAHQDQIGTAAAHVAEQGLLAARALAVIDYPAPAPAAADPLPVPPGLAAAIAFERVSFRYPGTDRPTLCDVSFVMPAGATVVLAGENGAGKTTLAKLLCRFYDPTEGRVTADGTDLARFDVAAWRKRISATLQDFGRYHFTVGEAVGIGNLDRADDPDRLRRALREGGAASFVDRLPEQVESQLGRDFPGGIELSFGQWQKIALARGLMVDDPLLVILDEPSAHLDPEAEAELFARYRSAARAGGPQRGVTVLVSHRFSLVAEADLVVFLHEGRVIEVGPHRELLARGGPYAELFKLQADGYTR